MAIYIFSWPSADGRFLAAVAALCLIGEDTAMAAVTFHGLSLSLEPRKGRSYGLAGAALAIPYLLFILLVVQPASRAELTLLSATNMSNVIRTFSRLTPRRCWRATSRRCGPLSPCCRGSSWPGWRSGWPSKARARLIAGLALVSTAPFWRSRSRGVAGHDLMPAFISTYLALV